MEAYLTNKEMLCQIFFFELLAAHIAKGAGEAGLHTGSVQSEAVTRHRDFIHYWAANEPRSIIRMLHNRLHDKDSKILAGSDHAAGHFIGLRPQSDFRP